MIVHGTAFAAPGFYIKIYTHVYQFAPVNVIKTYMYVDT